MLLKRRGGGWERKTGEQSVTKRGEGTRKKKKGKFHNMKKET